MVQILVPTEQGSLVCTPNNEKKSVSVRNISSPGPEVLFEFSLYFVQRCNLFTTKALFLHFYLNKAFCSSSVSESRHAQANSNRLNSKPSIGANQPGRKSGNKTYL